MVAICLFLVIPVGQISGLWFAIALVLVYFTWGEIYSLFPATAAERPRETIATVKIQVTCVRVQSSAALATTPRTLINGGLKTLHA